MKLIILCKEDSVASLVSAVDTKSNEEKWPIGWGVQEPWLSPKAGIPPLFRRKEKLMSVPNEQPSWVEALRASLKPFPIVWFSDGFWLF